MKKIIPLVLVIVIAGVRHSSHGARGRARPQPAPRVVAVPPPAPPQPPPAPPIPTHTVKKGRHAGEHRAAIRARLSGPRRVEQHHQPQSHRDRAGLPARCSFVGWVRWRGACPGWSFGSHAAGAGFPRRSRRVPSATRPPPKWSRGRRRCRSPIAMLAQMGAADPGGSPVAATPPDPPAVSSPPTAPATPTPPVVAPPIATPPTTPEPEKSAGTDNEDVD